jgi:hypothetical protein
MEWEVRFVIKILNNLFKILFKEHNRRLKAQQPQSRAASFSPLRNVALKKAKDEANKNGNKRKSMTIDSAEQQTHWKMAFGKKEVSKKLML